MILFTHAIAGAAVAEAVRDPVGVFIFAFASHFILDALPHWDYHLRSVKANLTHGLQDIALGRDFAFDFFKISVDAILGTLLALYMYGYLLTPGDYGIIFLGVFGGLLPDLLQFVYCKIHREPLISLQRFHEQVHTKHRWVGRYIVGATSQALIVLVIFLIVKKLI
jgi:hypothetical protein